MKKDPVQGLMILAILLVLVIAAFKMAINYRICSQYFPGDIFVCMVGFCMEDHEMDREDYDPKIHYIPPTTPNTPDPEYEIEETKKRILALKRCIAESQKELNQQLKKLRLLEEGE